VKKLISALIACFLAVSASAATIYVDAYGTGDYPTIQAAIDDANEGDEIELLPGRYTGDGNRDIEFRGKILTVRSTNPDDPCVVAATVIDCEGTEIEPHRGFRFHSGESSDSIIAGLTITNGYGPEETHQGGTTSVGGAISCFNSSPTITKCVIEDNISGTMGAGIYANNSNVTITDCVIRGNLAGSCSAGVHVRIGRPTVTRSVIIDNSGGDGTAIFLLGCTSPIISHCMIMNNTSSGKGGGIYTNGNHNSINIENCVICNNVATSGGGILCNRDYVGLTITNCTISGNSAIYFGGGVYEYLTSPRPNLKNCILWGNTASNGPQLAGQILISYSDIQGGYSGTGNINMDPLFYDPDNSDYHILPSSPCIDAGNNTAVPNDKTDMDGDGNTVEPIPWDIEDNKRFVDHPNVPDTGYGTPPVVDMGACEFFLRIEVAMRFTPQAMNPKSKGRWFKAHLVLSEGFSVEDVDINEPVVAQIEELVINADHVEVFENEDGFVEIEAAFERAALCGIAAADDIVEVTVEGQFTDGHHFYGTDSIKVITRDFTSYLGALASHWLQIGCSPPDWCDGLDIDQDSAVNFVDFSRFDRCCIEVVQE